MSLISGRQRILAEWPSCYACDSPKASREHVPPLCFFPDEKDINNQSLFRKNLISVPSCDVHNTGKSEDDFYAAFHLAGTIRGNHCASLVRNGVIARAMKRDQDKRGGAFTKLLVSQIRGKLGENFVGQLDPERMVNFLKLCARGLYFYEKLKPLKLPLRVASVDYELPDPVHRKQCEAWRTSFNAEMQGCEFHGDNRDVFTYAVCEKPEKNVVMVEMVFFGEIQRWAFYHPEAERQFGLSDWM
jgi:hypothetical protein